MIEEHSTSVPQALLSNSLLAHPNQQTVTQKKACGLGRGGEGIGRRSLKTKGEDLQ